MQNRTWIAVGVALLVAAACAPSVADTNLESDNYPTFSFTETESWDPGQVAAYDGKHPEVYAHIDEHQEEHLAHLQRWLRQPSISAQNVGIAEMAEMVRSDLEGLGFSETEIVPTSGHPGVWGYYDARAEKTLALYMMYDVQPVNAEDWRSPPFDAAVVDHPLGRALIARGATNQKGPERALLNAIESILAVEGTLPVNLMVLAEGEEELGSPHYPELVDRFEERLKTADGAFFPFNSQSPGGGDISMSLGVKGILYFEMEARGGAWGGPRRSEIHGSFRAVVDSPVLRLTEAIASMTSTDTNTITIPGYYDDVRAPTPEEQRLINFVAESYDPSGMQRLFGVERFIDDLDGRDAILRQLYDVTLNVDGIWGGYIEEGVKTILPHRATAKMDSRLPPTVDPDEALAKIRAHLDAQGYEDIELRKLSGYPAAQTSVEAPIVQAAISVFNKWGRTSEVWPRLAGSAPFYQFTERLGLPLVFNGLGHGSGAHAPNEYMLVEPNESTGVAGLADIEKSYVDLLYALADGE